jgi:glutamyl-tRNA synthetase
LFNWLFARRHGGKYLLRIEDTDRARSTQEAIDAIIGGLSWLGLEADDAPIFQFPRAPRHREVAEAMVERGAAFRCYATPEEVEQLRKEAQSEGRALRSPWRDGGAARPGARYVVRLRAPDEGEIVNDDLIQGPVRVRARDIDDLVLLRADGVPTYMLAVVVDDHDMGITHVIRGDDHLTNAARQIPIFRAMDWPVPAFAHVPLIHGPDGKKLGKRTGAVAVEAYRDDMGYLPEGLTAYLMRLGWSPGHDDILSKEDAVPLFDIRRVVKSPARLDFEKLGAVNAHFLRKADDARLARLTFDFISKHKPWRLDPDRRAKLAGAIPVFKERAKTIADLAEMSLFVLRDRPIELDAAAQKAITGATERLARLSVRLAELPAWEAAALAAELKAFAAAEGVGLGAIGPPLRAALTGGGPAPDLGHTLELLGRAESLARIADQIP